MEERNQVQAPLARPVPEPSAFAVLRGIDFTGLNAAIEKLAESGKELTPEEKKEACKILDTWHHDVIERLQNRDLQIQVFLEFFLASTRHDYHYNCGDKSRYEITDEQQQELAQFSGTSDLYAVLSAIRFELTALCDRKPHAPTQDPDRTPNEFLIARRQYDLELAQFEILERRFKTRLEVATNNWKKALSAIPAVQEALKKARSLSRNIDTLKADCQDRAQLAKLNVSISSDATRASLRELIAFVKTIG